jgi:hypothetical protein
MQSARAEPERLSVADVAADTDCMTWLFPEPDLEPGERITWKTKAQLAPDSGRQSTGVLYLTNRHVFFVPGRGTPKARNSVLRFASADCTDVVAIEGRFGYSAAQGALKCIRLAFSDRSATFWVRHRDDAVDLLRRELHPRRTVAF